MSSSPSCNDIPNHAAASHGEKQKEEDFITVESTETQMKVHGHVQKLADAPYFFQFIKMNSCVWIWISDSSLTFSDLSVGIPTKFSAIPMGTEVITRGNSNVVDGFSKSLALRISKKFSTATSPLVCYISYNAPTAQHVQQFIEKTILEQLKNLL